jgi:hypothetical protein
LLSKTLKDGEALPEKIGDALIRSVEKLVVVKDEIVFDKDVRKEQKNRRKRMM